MPSKKQHKDETSEIEAFLKDLEAIKTLLLEKGIISDSVVPKSHCCECTPGPHFQRHAVHIQYHDCTCSPEKYVLKKNEGE